MVSKTKKKFLMQLTPKDKKLFVEGMRKSGAVSRAALVRMGLESIAKGGK